MTYGLQKKYVLTEKGAKDLIKATFLTVLANLSLMLPVRLLVYTLNNIIQSLVNKTDPAVGILNFFIVGLVLITVIYVIHLYQYKALYIATYTESANRRIRLAEKLRLLPMSFFEKRDLSDLTATMMSDCSSLEQCFSSYIPQMRGSIISTTLVFIGILIINWRMGLAVIWVVPLSFIMVFASKYIQYKYGRKAFLSKREVTESLQEIIETVKDIKACNRKEFYLKGLNDKLHRAEKNSIYSELITGSCITGAQAFLKIGIATTVLVGVTLLVDGKIDIIILLIYLIVASRIYEPVNIIFMHIAAVFDAKIKIERMRKIEEEPIQTGVKECSPENYDICFDCVNFSYNNNEGVLDQVSFTANQGEVTALVGPSGGGKTTTAKLAARFWDVCGGKITLGGIDIKSVDPETLFESYSIVFQDVVLFRDTVMENIRLGRSDASDEEVIKAAKIAQCNEFITNLPKGYHTLIGENGCTLSGGERQRISIARAILKDAPIILLDEATASLDVENETAIQVALSGLIKNKTVIIIAHRMRTVMGADKIVVIANGKINQIGKPDELLQQEGLFCNMVKLQTEIQNWDIKDNEI